MYDLDKNAGSYDCVIDSFEVDVLFSEEDDDYQGDAFYALRDNGRYGFLIFGWGSCSGCDSLQAAYGNVAELNELRDELWDSVTWFDSAEDLRDFLKNRDGALQWYGSSRAYKKFVARSGEFTDY